MADNVVADPGTGGATLATDDVGGVHYPISKIAIGALDSVALLTGGNGTTDAGTVRVTISSDTTGVVGVGSIIPGVAATNLGKAIDSVVGGTDTGVALLAKHVEDNVHITTADGDYEILEVDSRGALTSSIEQHHTFDELDATTGWSALNDDTTNIATTTIHAIGTNALTFDKVNGTANTVFAAIQKTVSSTDLGSVSPHDIIQTMSYIPDITNVDYLFIRIGTNNTNYNEWRIPSASLTAAEFETLAFIIGDISHSGSTGTGWDSSAITWFALGVAFNAETDTLAGIIFDQLSYHTNTHTSASIQSEVTSSVSSSNVNVQKVGNQVVNTQAGNVANGTQRVTIATDDVNLAAINVDTSTIAGAVTGTEMQVDVITMPTTTVTATALDIRALTNADTVTAELSATDNAVLDNIDTSTATSAGSVAVDDASYTAGTDSGSPVMGLYNLSPNPVSTDGDVGVLAMDINRGLRVSNFGAFTVQEDGLVLTAIEKIDNSLVAIDDPVSTIWGNMAGVNARSTESSAVGDGDAQFALASLLGKQVNLPYSIPASTWNYATATLGVTDTSDDVAKTASGAGIRNYITSAQVINGHATVGTEVVIKDGSTVLWRGWAEPTGGGVSAKFDPPLRGTANTAVNVANITTGSKTYFNLQGYVAAE